MTVQSQTIAVFSRKLHGRVVLHPVVGESPNVISDTSANPRSEHARYGRVSANQRTVKE